MKRIYLFTLVYLVTISFIEAQVGLNTDNPAAALHINNIVENEKNGIILPQLDEFPITVTGDQDSMLIYITGNGSVTKGYWYYEHGSGWKRMLQGDSADSQKAFLNPKFPDGMKGMIPITIRPLAGYTIPSGKNLYITAAYSDNNGSVLNTVNLNTGIASVLISGSRGSWVFPTFNNPIILGDNHQISGTYLINGFLVDATVEPIISNSNYTVPSGKRFVYLNSNVVNATTNVATRIDGQIIYYAGVLSSTNNGVSPLSIPIFVDENQNISTDGFNSTVMGYLIDR